jgi:hypothetical protein
MKGVARQARTVRIGEVGKQNIEWCDVEFSNIT